MTNRFVTLAKISLLPRRRKCVRYKKSIFRHLRPKQICISQINRDCDSYLDAYEHSDEHLAQLTL